MVTPKIVIDRKSPFFSWSPPSTLRCHLKSKTSPEALNALQVWFQVSSSTDPTKEGESRGFEEENIAHAAECLRTPFGFTVLSFLVHSWNAHSANKSWNANAHHINDGQG